METRGIRSFDPIQKRTLQNQAKQHTSGTSSLSTAEMDMINDKFSSQNNVPLETYGGSGEIRTKQPAARGTNLDITV